MIFSNAYKSKKTCRLAGQDLFRVKQSSETGTDLKSTPTLARKGFSSLQLISLLGQLGIVFLLAYAFSQPPGPPIWAACGAAVYDYDMTPKVVALIVFGLSGMGLTAWVYQKAEHWMPRIGMWFLGTMLICAAVLVPPAKTVVTPEHECDLSDVRF